MSSVVQEVSCDRSEGCCLGKEECYYGGEQDWLHYCVMMFLEVLWSPALALTSVLSTAQRHRSPDPVQHEVIRVSGKLF